MQIRIEALVVFNLYFLFCLTALLATTLPWIHFLPFSCKYKKTLRNSQGTRTQILIKIEPETIFISSTCSYAAA